MKQCILDCFILPEIKLLMQSKKYLKIITKNFFLNNKLVLQNTCVRYT